MLLIKPRKNRKGFTLIELIVVVSILAILAAVAIPSFIGLQTKATNSAINANAATICNAILVWNAYASDPAAAATKITGSAPASVGDFNTTAGAVVNLSMSNTEYTDAVTKAKILVSGTGTATYTKIP